MERVLVIAAHSDDEVLGCGGTIAKHAMHGDLVWCLLMTDRVTSRGENNDLFQERRDAQRILGITNCIVRSFQDQMMDTIPQAKLADSISQVVRDFSPTIVYTHNRDDCNADHRSVYWASMVACRPWTCSVERVFLFEIPGNNWHCSFDYNIEEDISETLQVKLHALACYKSELREWPHPRSLEHIKRLDEVELFKEIGD
jgi:N-acetylglucosamine malate deacetylase 1